jgi:hypothetical protein
VSEVGGAPSRAFRLRVARFEQRVEFGDQRSNFDRSALGEAIAWFRAAAGLAGR